MVTTPKCWCSAYRYDLTSGSIIVVGFALESMLKFLDFCFTIAKTCIYLI